jgi:tetratricopeptide (TPR) repeat protein
LLHFARALADAGNTEESKTVMDRFRNLGPEKQNVVPPGLVEYMSLTEDQRRADYRARVEKTIQSHPEDAAARLALLKLLLKDGPADRVTETAREVAGLNPSASILADAGRALLAAKWGALAVELLTKAAVDPPADLASGIALDLAIATLRAGDAAKGLELLDRVPASARAGDYYLARAEILMADGKSQEAQAAIDQALRTAPQSADFYLYATAFLVRNKLDSQALRFLDQAAGALPGHREILLLRAAALDLLGRTADAERLFREIENRWPEWYPAWAAHGIVTKAHNEPEKAQRLLDTAKALGAPAGKLGIDLRSILEGALSQ